MASNSDPTSSSAQPASQELDVICESYLDKRGRVIKIFWKRYFKLLRNGDLEHFRDPPVPGQICSPYKIINVKNGEFLPTKVPRPYSLHIRKRQDTEIEYVFAADTKDLLTDWHNRLVKNFGQATAMDTVEAEVPKLCTDEKTGLHGYKRKAKLDDFSFLSVLGSGSFARVILVRCRESKKLYALKMIKRRHKPKYYGATHPKTESHVLFMCHHPFLTSMSHSFNTSRYHCFVMDFGIGGDLRFHLEEAKESNTGFSIDRTRFYAAEIASGLGFLHSNNIIYRDLKLENVLLDGKGHVKIADFGLCHENMPARARTITVCGTPWYMAPEALFVNREEGYGQAADWWSFGVVVFEMLFNRFPRADTIPKTKEDLLKYTDPDFSGPCSIDDEDTKEFIKSLLREDPSVRLGGSRDFEEVKEHPFFDGIVWSVLSRGEMQPPFVPEIDEENVMKYFDIRHLLHTPVDQERLNEPIQLYNDDELNRIWAQFSFHEDLIKTVIPEDAFDALLFCCMKFE